MSYDGQIEERAADQMGAVYRSCPVLRDHIALGAVLQGVHAEKELVRSTMDELRKQRTESQPHYRSAGCMFKNPEGFSAGKLVDECCLKGLSEGGAKVSEQHGNFIVNDGTATAENVILLIDTVRTKVREIRGIDLQTEVQIVGER
jgi:UDP-N-acetylenolpyruvoylglucosamine reductase